MPYLLAGLLVLVLVFWLSRKARGVNSKALLSNLRPLAALVCILVAGVLVLTGRVAAAVPLAMIGLSLWGRLGSGLGNYGRSRAQPGQKSKVQTEYLCLELDHDSGKITGRVLQGPFQGRELDDLIFSELEQLYTEWQGEDDSLRLLETYLDSRAPDWRSQFQADMHGRSGGAAQSGTMTHQEAYDILGLHANASKAEIIAAHRRIMALVHPDKGGSTYLATRVNAAKDILLKRHTD
jgi:hypothetical protein